MKQKQVIRHYCDLAFEKDEEMSLMETVSAVKPDHLALRLNDGGWSVEEILKHVGFWKSEYCRQGFEIAASEWEWPEGDLGGMAKALRTAHKHMCACLEACSEEDLAKSILTRFHGETAAHFFSVMAMHDISHAVEQRERCHGCGPLPAPLRS